MANAGDGGEGEGGRGGGGERVIVRGRGLRGAMYMRLRGCSRGGGDLEVGWLAQATGARAKANSMVGVARLVWPEGNRVVEGRGAAARVATREEMEAWSSERRGCRWLRLG